MKKRMFISVVMCTAMLVVLTVNASSNTENNDMILSLGGTFIATHAKDITFYNGSAKNCWFRISGADWIYSNGTILFKRSRHSDRADRSNSIPLGR